MTAIHGIAVLVTMLLVACTDGYQGKDDPVRLHYDMSRAETLAALNKIGAERAGRKKMRFSLLDGCVLELHLSTRVNGRDTLVLPLQRATTTVEGEISGGLYRVVLKMPGLPPPSRAVVLDQASWTEAIQMRWLLDSVRRFC
jgi:hypothetical protein